LSSGNLASSKIHPKFGSSDEKQTEAVFDEFGEAAAPGYSNSVSIHYRQKW
jgi:hypothetical protein